MLAGGIDTVYPEENRELHEAIAERGVLAAEMPVGMVPQARHFPRRNRIISGIALGVLVVEAAVGSGSLITARCASDQGREVFAVPGSPLDPRCRGTNDLIRKGARIWSRAPPTSWRNWRRSSQRPWPSAAARCSRPPTAALDESRARPGARQLVDAPLTVPGRVDELVRQCHLSPALVVTVLLELELAGRIERQPGNQVALL